MINYNSKLIITCTDNCLQIGIIQNNKRIKLKIEEGKTVQTQSGGESLARRTTGHETQT